MARFENLAQMQRESCKAFSDRPVFGEKKGGTYQWITYGEFAQMVEHCQGGLAQLGVGKGDRVACIANNRTEWAVGAYATYNLAAVWVPMYEAQLAKDWKYILNDCGAKVLIVANDAIYDKTRAFVEEIESLEHIVNLAGTGEGSWTGLLASGKAHAKAPNDVAPDDIMGLIYTSGTTGNPKGVVLSHANIVSNVDAIQGKFDIGPEDVSLSFLPWAHSFGQTAELHVLTSLGASLGLAESVQTLIQNFSEVKPTILISVPRVFNKIYDGLRKRMADESGFKRFMFQAGLKAAADKRGALDAGRSPGGWTKFRYGLFDKLVFSKVRDRFGGRLRYACSGGAALSPEVATFIDDMNITVYEGYGLTETSPIVTTNRPEARKIGSVGKAIPGVEVIIDGADGKPNTEGEVMVAGPNVMVGYYNLPDQTADVIFEQEGKRIFRTGDLGKLDDEGFLFITGRVKEIYKLENGKYVAPAPLEEQLQLSGYILQVFISGFNKPYNIALIVPDAEAVLRWANEHGVSGSLGELCENDAVRGLIQEELDKYGADFKGYERPRKFLLVPDEMTVDNGMLTPSMKMKRRTIEEVYGERLDALYAGEAEGRKAAPAKTDAGGTEAKAASKPATGEPAQPSE
jgi:long-chain acyl-CoA synthetase